MFKNMTEQLELYKSDETSHAFFDIAIFCTNVTYVDGSFKKGASFSSLPSYNEP